MTTSDALMNMALKLIRWYNFGHFQFFTPKLPAVVLRLEGVKVVNLLEKLQLDNSILLVFSIL